MTGALVCAHALMTVTLVSEFFSHYVTKKKSAYIFQVVILVFTYHGERYQEAESGL